MGFGHGLWLRYQVIGGEPGTFSGTTGLYASQQNYELPSLFSKVQDALGYEIQRTDFTLPLSVGHLKKWRWVSLEWGGVIQAQLTQIRYEFAPTTAYEVVSENGGEPFLQEIPQQRQWFFGGAFALHYALELRFW